MPFTDKSMCLHAALNGTSGNHLLRDAWALAVLPGCFEGGWARARWRSGQSLYWRCLLEQVDADGVHEERTPMYLARALRDALEILTICDALNEPVPAIARLRV